MQNTDWKINVAVIGINGYGRKHVKAIRELVKHNHAKVIAFCDMNINESSEEVMFLRSEGALYYSDYKEMLKAHPELDMVTVATPLYLHTSMAIDVMEANCNLYLEKPPAITIQDVDRMIEVQKKTGMLCTVGFQNTCCEAFQRLLKLISDGTLGKISHITGVGMWKRDSKYYARTPWAGKLTHNGNYVLDGTIFNPLSHLLNNCLIAAGAGETAYPEEVSAELYKAHDIESEDTSCVKIKTKNGIDILFLTTLCHVSNDSPYITVYGSEYKAVWSLNDNFLSVFDKDGKEVIHYESELHKDDLTYIMFRTLAKACAGKRQRIYSPLDQTRNFVLAGNAAFLSSQRVHSIPKGFITVTKDEKGVEKTVINDIDKIILQAEHDFKMFSEQNYIWAIKPEKINTRDLTKFSL